MDFHFMPISDSLWLWSEYFFWMSNFHRNYLKKHVLYSMNLYVTRARSTLSGAAQNGQCMTSKYPRESHSKA